MVVAAEVVVVILLVAGVNTSAEVDWVEVIDAVGLGAVDGTVDSLQVVEVESVTSETVIGVVG